VVLPPIRQKLSFLNDRFLVSALVKSNDLLMMKLEETPSSLEYFELPSRMVNCHPLIRFDICAKGTQRCSDVLEGHQ
jgi:hypothetical protein